MKKTLIITVLILNFVAVTRTLAQLSLGNFSANVGTIRTTVSDHAPFSGYRYALYPELQLGGDLFTSYLRWTIYWGYWSDGITQPFPVMDMVTYSGQTQIGGVRFTFLPAEVAPHWPLPVGIFAGVARHFTAVTYVGGFGIDGKPGHDFAQTANTFEFGLNADFSLFGPFNVRAEIHQLFPLGNQYIDNLQKGRRAYKVGLAFTF